MNDQAAESEANAFARELLMPEAMVRDAVRKIGGVDLIEERPLELANLAKRFGVSCPLMAFRLGEISAQAPRKS